MIGNLPVTIEIKNERQLLEHLEALPVEVQERLRPTVATLTRELLTRVRGAEPFRTGAMRASTRSFIDSKPGLFLRGRVRVLVTPTGRRSLKGRGAHNVAAAALEYGVHSRFQVAAHRMRLSHVFKRPSRGGWVIVNAYTRRVNIAARRFLRDPFEHIKPVAEAEIKRKLDEKPL